MATLASDLLDFVLGLLRDPKAAEEFQENPTRTLAGAGLDNVCPADLDDVQSLLAFVPEVAGTSAGLTSLPAATSVASASLPGAATPASSVASASLPGAVVPAGTVPLTTQLSPIAAAEDDVVIERLRDIQQTYTYNATTTFEVRDNIWAGRDVYEVFGDENVVAVGGSVAAGGDVEDVELDHSIEDAFNIDDSFNPENSGNTQIGAGNVNGDDADVDLDNSGNTVRGDGNAVGDGNTADNTDRSVNVDGDGNATGRNSTADNRDNSIRVDDSTGVSAGDDNTVGDVADGNGNALGNTVDIRDSGNDNSDNSDNSRTDNSTDDDVIDSYNEDNDALTTEDVVIGNGSSGGDLDRSVEDNDDFTADLENSPIDFGPGSAQSAEDTGDDAVF